MNINPNINSASAALPAQTLTSNQVTDVSPTPSKVIDFTGTQTINGLTANNDSSVISLFEQLSSLLNQLLSKTETNTSRAQTPAAYKVDPSLAVSNMTTTTGLSAANIKIHNEDGSSLRGNAVDTATGFSREEVDGKINHSFTLAEGQAIARNNPLPDGSPDLHSRLEAHTSARWKESDNETHTFVAQYDLGSVQNKTTIFQIKDVQGPPATFVQVRTGNNPETPETEGPENYYVFIAGRDRELTEGQRTRFNLKLERDGTPAKFNIEATSDGDTFSVKVQNNEDTLVTGTHGSVPQTQNKDNLTFRWGLYNNSVADQTSTANVNNIRITSEDN